MGKNNTRGSFDKLYNSIKKSVEKTVTEGILDGTKQANETTKVNVNPDKIVVNKVNISDLLKLDASELTQKINHLLEESAKTASPLVEKTLISALQIAIQRGILSAEEATDKGLDTFTISYTKHAEQSKKKIESYFSKLNSGNEMISAPEIDTKQIEQDSKKIKKETDTIKKEINSTKSTVNEFKNQTSQGNKIKIFDGIKEVTYDVIKDYDLILEKMQEVADKMSNPVFHTGNLSKKTLKSKNYESADNFGVMWNAKTAGQRESPGNGIYVSSDAKAIRDRHINIDDKRFLKNQHLYALDLKKYEDEMYSFVSDNTYYDFQSIVEGITNTVFKKFGNKNAKSYNIKDLYTDYEEFFKIINVSLEDITNFIEEAEQYTSTVLKDMPNIYKKDSISKIFAQKFLGAKKGLNASRAFDSDSDVVGSVIFDIDKNNPYSIDFGDNTKLYDMFFDMVKEKILMQKATYGSGKEYTAESKVDDLLYKYMIEKDELDSNFINQLQSEYDNFSEIKESLLNSKVLANRDIKKSKDESNQEQNQLSTEIDKTNQKLKEENDLYAQIYKRIEAIRVLGAVGRKKSELDAYGRGEYGYESLDSKSYAKQQEILNTLSPSGKLNPSFRDLVMGSDKSIDEVAQILTQASEDYIACKNALDEIFAKLGIVGGDFYNDAYRELDLHSDDSIAMAEVVGDIRNKINMLQQQRKAHKEVAEAKRDEAQAQAELNEQKEAEPTSTPTNTIDSVKREIENTIVVIKNVLNKSLDTDGIISKYLFGKNGVKSSNELKSEIESEIKSITQSIYKSNKQGTDNDYMKALEQPFRKWAVLESMYGEYKDNFNGSRGLYERWWKSDNNKWVKSKDELSDDAYSYYGKLIEEQEKLSILQKDNGQSYLSYMEEAKRLAEEITQAQKRNENFKPTNFNNLNISQEEADEKAKALRAEAKALNELVKSIQEFNEKNVQFDVFEDSPLHLSTLKLDRLLQTSEKMNNDADKYANLTNYKRTQQRSLFEQGVNMMNIPKDLESEYERLDDEIYDGSKTGQEAIEAFNLKAKELGYTFDEDTKKWKQLQEKVSQGASQPVDSKTTESVKRSQEEIRADIERTNQVIKVQNEWLRETAIIDQDFKTSGKGAANDQLRRWTRRLTDYRMHPERFYGEGTLDEDQINVGWYRSYKEAERQGSARSVLAQNHTDIYESDYNKSLANLERDRDIAKQILAQAQEDLKKYENELRAVMSSTSDTSAQDKTIEKLNETADAATKAKDAIVEEKETEGQSTTTPSAIDEITQAEDRIGNEAQKATNQMSEGAKEVAGNLHLITDELGNIKVFYRGLRDSMGQGLVSDRFNGATFWTDSFDLAKEYSNWTKVESAQLGMIRPLEIEGNGANWNNIEYLGNGLDEASEKIIAAKEKMYDAIGDMQHYAIDEGYQVKDLTSNFGMDEFRRYMSEVWLDVEGFDEQLKQEMQQIKDTVEEGWAEYKAISDDKTNVYGRHNTKEFVAMAQETGQFDGVIFKNIVDSASGIVKDATNVVVQFNENQIKFLETISASSNLNERDVFGITKNYAEVIKSLNYYQQENEKYISEFGFGKYDGRISELKKYKEQYESILPILTEYQEKISEIQNAEIDRSSIQISDETKQRVKNGIFTNLKSLYEQRDSLTKEMIIDQFGIYDDDVLEPLYETLKDESTTTNDLKLLTDQLYEQEVKRYVINREIQKIKAQQVSELSKDIYNDYTKSNQLTTPSTTTDTINQEAEARQQNADVAKQEAEAVDESNKKKQGNGDSASESAKKTASGLSDETKKFNKIATSADKATEAKKRFAEANGDVLKSIIDSLTALNAEGDGFNNLNKIINNLANNKDDRITNLIKNLTSLRNVLTQKVDEDAFINAIKEIASQGDSLKDVAAVLKASKEDVEKAQKATGKIKNVIPKEDIKSTEKDINSLKTRIEKLGNTDLLNELNGIKLAFDSIGDDADKLKAVKQSMEALTDKTKTAEEAIKTQAKDAKELVDNYSKLAANTNKLKTLDPNSKAAKMLQEENEKLEKRNEKIKDNTYTEQQNQAIQEAKRNLDLALAGAEDKKTQATLKAAEAEEKARIAHENRRNSLRAQASELLKNGKINATYGTQIRQMIQELSDTNIAENKLTEISNKLKEIKTQANLTGKSGKTLFQMLKGRMSGLLTYLGTFASFYRIVGYIRTAFSTIKELDTQLVDLRKTTTMTTTELNQFYNASSDVAKQLGVTTSEIISQAAAWSRLGYSSKEAATEMAQISSQFASISPGMTTDKATDYLVSTMQAYGIAVDDVERKVLDNVNKIGKKLPKHTVTYGVILNLVDNYIG